MSLDVYLTAAGSESRSSGDRIYIRRAGQTVEITREEWDELYPERTPSVLVAVPDDGDYGYVFQANITHNLGKMARACEMGNGWTLYDALWRPDEHGWTHARDLTGILRDGLAILNSDRDRLEAFNPANGWGDYDLLVRFTAGYLVACERWPEAEVSVSR